MDSLLTPSQLEDEAARAEEEERAKQQAARLMRKRQQAALSAQAEAIAQRQVQHSTCCASDSLTLSRSFRQSLADY